MLLTDHQIGSAVESGQLGIEPFDETKVQPASYDVHLGPGLREFRFGVIDLGNLRPGHTRPMEIDPEQGYPLLPGAFVLGHTVEEFRMSGQIVGRVEGKSSLGRLGLAVHSTAGYIDPGFCGQITLELKNNGPVPLILRPGLPIGQIAFEALQHTPKRLYGAAGNHYQGQSGPVESRFGM